jgi:hypothetical protein
MPIPLTGDIHEQDAGRTSREEGGLIRIGEMLSKLLAEALAEQRCFVAPDSISPP